MLAAELGLPYAFASHFAPALLIPSLQIYRSRFKPSEQLDRPYAMVGVNIIAAESDAEAGRLATTQQMSFVNLLRGARGLSQPRSRLAQRPRQERSPRRRCSQALRGRRPRKSRPQPFRRLSSLAVPALIAR
jgi:alkanesulfonate monooxygenase SsuD/methylene tetrahydromethanopterin reductase-like flavin-dependent oxidoreductase (luciferase family)